MRESLVTASPIPMLAPRTTTGRAAYATLAAVLLTATVVEAIFHSTGFCANPQGNSTPPTREYGLR
jgi:hypothetical protein